MPWPFCSPRSRRKPSPILNDVLKIDRQFVAGLEKDRHAPAIIETILAMAATLDMQVVAEGIEREPDAEFLRRRGIAVIDHAIMAVAHQPAHDVSAHPAEADHAKLHAASPIILTGPERAWRAAGSGAPLPA